MTNAGILNLQATTTDAAFDTKRLTLISTDRSKAYTIGLDTSDPPLIIITEKEPAYGGYEQLYVFSPNGREWGIQAENVGGDGILSVVSLNKVWDTVQNALVLTSPDNMPWRFETADNGIYQVTSDPAETIRRDCTLLSQDDTTAWKLTIDNNGAISVTDTLLANGKFYDAEITSPSGVRWFLQVDQNGILSMDNIDDITSLAVEWPLVVAKHGKLIYIVDERFPAPKGARRR